MENPSVNFYLRAPQYMCLKTTSIWQNLLCVRHLTLLPAAKDLESLRVNRVFCVGRLMGSRKCNVQQSVLEHKDNYRVTNSIEAAVTIVLSCN
jgi:hypothetical protein